MENSVLLVLHAWERRVWAQWARCKSLGVPKASSMPPKSSAVAEMGSEAANCKITHTRVHVRTDVRTHMRVDALPHGRRA